MTKCCHMQFRCVECAAAKKLGLLSHATAVIHVHKSTMARQNTASIVVLCKNYI